MSIDAGAQVAIILLACRPCVVIVNYLGQVLYLGRASHTKKTLPDFRECWIAYSTSTSIPRVDGLSTDTPVLGVTACQIPEGGLGLSSGDKNSKY